MVSRTYGTLAEAAEILTVSRQTVRRMISDGRLTGYRMGTRALRVDLEEVYAFRPMNVAKIRQKKNAAAAGGGGEAA